MRIILSTWEFKEKKKKKGIRILRKKQARMELCSH